MYKKGIKIVLLTVILVTCICTLGVISTKEGVRKKTEDNKKTAEEIEKEEELDWLLDYVDEELADLQLDYKITERWEEYCYVEITLTNITDGVVEDWEINLPANYEIEHICDAEIKDFFENVYTLRNTEKNHDILKNGKICFGMLVKVKEEPKFPTYLETNTFRDEVDQEKYKMTFEILHKWKNVVNGKITITNKTYTMIEDWSAELESNLKMEQIWNATVKSEIEDEDNKDVAFYDLHHPENAQNIGPKESVEIGFIAECDEKPKFSRFQLYGMSWNQEDNEEEDEEED